MTDFTIRDYTIGYSIFNALLFLFVSFFNKYNNLRNFKLKPIPRYRKLFLYIGVLLFTYVSIYGDFFNYMDMVYTYNKMSTTNYGEPIYGDIIEKVGKNYLLFRIVVWTPALIFTYLTFKKFQLQTYNSLYILFVGFILTFANLRASLGLSIYYLGLSILLASHKHNIFNLLAGITIILLSFMFHRSIIVLIAMTPLCFLRLNKKVIVMIFCLFIFGLFWFMENFDNFLTSDIILSNADIAKKTQGYATKDVGEANLGGYIHMFVRYSPYLVALFVTSYYLLGKSRLFIAPYIKSLYNFFLFLFLLSIPTLFLGLSNMVFFERILFMSFIPLVVIWSYMFQKHIISNRVHLTLLAGFMLSQSWDLLLVIIHS